MFKYIQKKYDFNNYQIAQLKFFFLTLISELSKVIIISIYFIDQYFPFLWCLLIFHLMRTTTGGIHCRNYISCLIISFLYFFLCISVLPNIKINQTTELILLFICTYICYKIGPVTSPRHMDLSIKSISNSKKRLIFIIFCYSIIVFIMPQYYFISVGFWVIMLDTVQLVISILRKEVTDYYEKKTR